MTRPSKNIDRKLISEGKKIICEKGLSELSVREVARNANVNLGMFHYYFKSKDEFVRILLESAYDDFFSKFSMEALKGKTDLEKLENSLFTMGAFVRDNRKLLLGLLSDLMMGRSEIIKFAKQYFVKHLRVLIDILDRCKKRKLIQDVSVYTLLPFCVAPVVTPSIVVSSLERSVKSRTAKLFLEHNIKKSVITDSALKQRIRFVLRGIGK
jgi:AcrR family transcriptional regulator